MMNKLRVIILFFATVVFTACSAQNSSQETSNRQQDANRADIEVQTQQFKDYWYAGKAELNHYNMQQIRYGEVHDGDAILVFVTEDFLADKQVKLESPADGRDMENVLKLNFLKEFVTGIYKYNVMTSTFTPVSINEHSRSLKVASSSQEWCGTTYSQLNLHGGQYDVTGHSYFEREADYKTTLDAVWLEDEIWTQLRLSPELLPEGEVDIIPASFGVRRSHTGWAVEKAEVQREVWKGEGMPGKNLMAYTINYVDRSRNLKIIYEKDFPYRIAGWIQTQQTDDGETLEARSVRTNSLNEPYWGQHDNADEPLRQKLGLES